MNNRIRELRQDKRITQLQLSIELEVTQETISSYENNRHLPSLSALLKMSKIFDASMDYIMGVSDVRHAFLELDSSAEECEQKNQLFYYYQRLGSKNKAQLLAYAQGLYDAQKE